MNQIPIKNIVDGFINAEDEVSEGKILPELIQYFEEKGPSNFRLNFWNIVKVEKKEVFIRGLFNHLIILPSDEKIRILKILRNLYLDSEPEIKEKTLMIFYSALLEDRNFKISLASLDFFTQMFSFFSDEEKKDIYGKLILFIEVAEEDIADEGINGINTILEYLTPEMLMEYFKTLIRLIKKKKGNIIFVSLENLEQLIRKNPKQFITTVEIENNIIFEEIMKIGDKTNRQKDPKIALSYLRVLLLFNSLFDEKREKYLQSKIDLCIKNEAEPREILLILSKFLNSARLLSYENNLKKIIPFLLKIYSKRAQFNPVVIDLADEIVGMVWNIIPDKEKEKFYNN